MYNRRSNHYISSNKSNHPPKELTTFFFARPTFFFSIMDHLNDTSILHCIHILNLKPINTLKFFNNTQSLPFPDANLEIAIHFEFGI